MNISQAKTLHLPSLLESAGAELDASKSHAQQDSYFFKLRDEKTASVHVWKAPNGAWCWKDHGTGEGGDIIKFGQHMAGNGSVSEGLAWLRQNAGQVASSQRQLQPGALFEQSRQRPAEPTQDQQPRQAKYTVEKVKHLFERPYNKNLLAFINSRAISPKIVAKYTKEIHFADERKKKMFGLGLKAEPTETDVLGGWEIRTALDAFPKCVIGDKNISIIDSPGLSRKTVHVFEGMFDFFAWMELTGQHHSNHPRAPVIVLNSANMAARAAEALNNDKRFASTEQVILWPQNDVAGQRSVEAFGGAISFDRFDFGTMEHVYEGFKDLAECWSMTPEKERPRLAGQFQKSAPVQKVYDTSATAEARRHQETLNRLTPPKLT